MINIRTAAVLCVCILLLVADNAAQQERGWRGLVPLFSTRSDVERLLGHGSSQCNCIYHTETEIVQVDYATAPCDGVLKGWNVPPGTVLRLSISPKEKQMFAELGIRESEFVKIYDDTLTSYYGNRSRGIRYVVSPSGEIRKISYIPSAVDTRLRCPGFPAEDTSIIDYQPLDSFFVSTWSDSVARLDPFAFQLQSDTRLKGYIIVYAGRNMSTNKTQYYARRLEDYVVKVRDIPAERVSTVYGGRRDRPTVDLFLVSSGMPAPIATPTVLKEVKAKEFNDKKSRR